MKKLLMWALYIVILCVVILPIEIATYGAECKFASWLAEKLGLC